MFVVARQVVAKRRTGLATVPALVRNCSVAFVHAAATVARARIAVAPRCHIAIPGTNLNVALELRGGSRTGLASVR